MILTSPQKEPSEVILKYKVLGVDRFKPFSSISDAADAAIKLISSGQGIPKTIDKSGVPVMSEADINLYWEQSR